MQIPAFLKILVIFGLILIAVRKKIILGNVFFGASIVTGLLFGLGIGDVLSSIIHSLSHPKTLALGCVVSLILVLSMSMEKAREMDRLLGAFQGLISNPLLNLVVFPALIGLLPMPGGAIFSAPMVKNIAKPFKVSPALLSYINYWFRHIWENWWPLYPGILLTTTLANIDLWKFILCAMPLTFIMVLGGYLSFKLGRAEEDLLVGKDQLERPPVKPFLVRLIPIGIVIIGGLCTGLLFNRLLPGNLQNIAKELGLISALLVAILFIWVKNRFSLRDCAELITEKQLLKMFYMVSSILVFKGILHDSHAADEITRELLAIHIPLVPVCITLPFIMGMITGITVAFVGTTFPILIALIHTFGESPFILYYMMLALACGFIGVMLSPVHLCFLLSNEYFHTNFQRVYRYMIIPCSLLFLSVICYFAVLRIVSGRFT